MKLEITKEQFDLIQNEIIRLKEVELPKAFENTHWRIGINEDISMLKEILKNEEVDLDKLQF
jgi:hypothetical protein